MNNVKRNWITTLFGVLTLAASIAPVWVPQEYAGRVQATAGILAGAGLVAAKDNNKSGTLPRD